VALSSRAVISFRGRHEPAVGTASATTIVESCKNLLPKG
jgi:hypothetical protein